MGYNPSSILLHVDGHVVQVGVFLFQNSTLKLVARGKLHNPKAGKDEIPTWPRLNPGDFPSSLWLLGWSHVDTCCWKMLEASKRFPSPISKVSRCHRTLKSIGAHVERHSAISMALSMFLQRSNTWRTCFVTERPCMLGLNKNIRKIVNAFGTT